MTEPVTTRRPSRSGEVSECPVCRDGIVLGMRPDEDAAWFKARHQECRREEER